MNRWTIVAVLAVLVWGVAAAAEEDARTEDVMKFSCKQLMSGNDADRGSGLAFFHGYRTAKSGTTTVDLTAASALSDKVQDYCLSNPSATVMDAFAKSAK